MIPVSDHIRPVFSRYLRRLVCEEWGIPLADPTEPEIHDAIMVLGERKPSPFGLADPVLYEATRILDEHGRPER